MTTDEMVADSVSRALAPIFCTSCGKRLVPDDRITGYNAYTGESIRPYQHMKVCGNMFCSRRFDRCYEFRF